jgi:S-(hydroxymethyl)glutathione dehydrogenase/alcohol dehydrogenase
MAKAAILEAPGQGLRIAEVTYAAPGPHEVLIDTKACGLCQSDLHFIDGHYPHALPAIPGHEAAGIVRAVGSEVRTVKPGDHVITCLSAYCGHCESCLTGRLSLCVSPDTKRDKDELRLWRWRWGDDGGSSGSDITDGPGLRIRKSYRG